MAIELNGLSDELLRTSGEPVGTPILKYPFLKDGDTQTKIIEQKYWLYANARSVPQIDAPLDEATASLFEFATGDMFLCEESEPTDIGCGLVEITRTFSNVPKTRSVRMPQSVTLFGITNTGNVVEKEITSECTINRNDAHGTTTITYPAEYIGKRVLVKTQNNKGNTYSKYFTIERTTTTYTLDEIGWYYYDNYSSFKLPNSVIYIGILSSLASRQPRATTADGFITYQYVKLTAQDSILTLPTPFEEANGELTLTAQTSPTVSEYSSMVANRTPYQSSQATVTMWLGNIAEIQTPYVYAI